MPSSLVESVGKDSLQNLSALFAHLSQNLSSFEHRPEQEAMMQAVADAYRKREIALIEAGTGTGKSIAYLLPAMLWAAETRERTVISTHTITLQEQLLKKEIPLLQKFLDLPVKVALVMGMKNYICLRRLNEASMEKLLMEEEERQELELLEEWAEESTEGSRSSLPLVPSPKTWEKVCAEQDTCNHRHCPFHARCFFFRARKEAQDANLLIVNHYLLFSDLAQRSLLDNYEKPFVLPPYSHLILDEAHHLEDVATEFFASRCSRKELLRILGRLASEKGKSEQGKLVQLRQKLVQEAKHRELPLIQDLLRRLTMEFPALRKSLGQAIVAAFQSLEVFLRQEIPQKEQQERELSLRLLPRHKERKIWAEEVLPDVAMMMQELKQYSEALSKMEEAMNGQLPAPLSEQTEGIRHEIRALALRLQETVTLIGSFLKDPLPKERVQWVQRSEGRLFPNLEWIEAHLEIAPLLQKSLFRPFHSLVFCSATLATEKDFSFVKKRWGLDAEFCSQRTVRTYRYESPFDYQRQMLFGMPTNLPSPDQEQYLSRVIGFLEKVVEACRGNALFLFTSFAMMDRCHQKLKPRFEERGFPVLKQGEDPRHKLLEQFRKGQGAVLFGTGTFWEGIDVQGDALGCVVMIKLPFAVPSEPLGEARMEAISLRGGSPFWEYSIPQAVVRFKQGFGRLIRHRTDRGCVICLDVRLGTKSYGKVFLNSLPPCHLVMAEETFLLQQVRQFFGSR